MYSTKYPVKPCKPAERPPLKPVRLLNQVRERIRYKHYSIRTEEAYVYWVYSFIRSHQLKTHQGHRLPRGYCVLVVAGGIARCGTVHAQVGVVGAVVSVSQSAGDCPTQQHPSPPPSLRTTPATRYQATNATVHGSKTAKSNPAPPVAPE